ncbi:type II CAAX endopeptidase family protein [Draconibacterium sp. IB214405]|uniref:CPBP family intramembrane glutamic endopeptidase n=1 Tax=Draconibacterium sp. IB214405 TaxID=3097352 RepID=UPI002A141726|nr:type II CAAX endopeptidase family protein [Draconibacterium sp. IB214405]MDX8340239.1 type II CAAX endopeptidase family protein [Draconibacterium sp. IB214405]
MILENSSERKEAWKTIFLFLALVVALTSPFHYALVNLYPSRIYVGAIMWCPAIAAIITLKIKGRKISSLNWNWGNWKYIRLSYFVPALYGIITYLLIWIFGFGRLVNAEVITDWAKELGLMGIGTLNPTSIIIIAIILLGTVEVIRSAATTLGEEIGWRGFFIYELRKVLSFTGVSVFSGVVWATWHWPVIVYYGNNVIVEMASFYVVIISMSFMMTYYTFKSKSLWPAVIFHAVSNVYIQKILPELTIKNEGTEYWLGENGIMFAIVTCVFGIYFWRKAMKEKL